MERTIPYDVLLKSMKKISDNFGGYLCFHDRAEIKLTEEKRAFDRNKWTNIKAPSTGATNFINYQIKQTRKKFCLQGE